MRLFLALIAIPLVLYFALVMTIIGIDLNVKEILIEIAELRKGK